MVPAFAGFVQIFLTLPRPSARPTILCRFIKSLKDFLIRAGAKFLVRDVKLDHPPIDEPALDKAIDDYSAGRSPFGVFSVFKGGLNASHKRLDRWEKSGVSNKSCC